MEAPATFFLGGDWIRTHPDETRQLAANPRFELANHSWSHPNLPDLDDEAIEEEILRTQAILYETTGRLNRLFRLPYGRYDDRVLQVAARNGLHTIQWDVVTADPDPTVSAAQIERTVRNKVAGGSIIIMHANGLGWNTGAALPEVIAWLRAEGYTLVTVSEMLGLAHRR
jgi:peptidoglycan/xylan/chitin deacetylase (PgdA/CDA1 family)